MWCFSHFSWYSTAFDSKEGDTKKCGQNQKKNQKTLLFDLGRPHSQEP